MMPQQELDETYNPLRVFASPTKIPSNNEGSSDQAMTQTRPMGTDAPSLQLSTVHMIPFDPEQMIQDCDDFSISSCEAKSLLEVDFQFVSSNSDAFWEQGAITLPSLDRQNSVSNVSLTSADNDDMLQRSTSQDSMQLS